MLEKQTSDVSRLALIRQWSMAGAPGELDGHFGAPPDIHALVAERNGEPSGDVPTTDSTHVMMKPAGEDDWRPLLFGISNAA